MATTLLRVDGMSCDHCVRSITSALEKLSGVTRADVSLEKRQARIEHADGQPSLDKMISVIEEEGYSAVREQGA
jgi:copper chaperone